MDFDSSDNSSALSSGKIKTRTFKQFQLDKLIKEGKVIPASKLTQAKEEALQRAKAFNEAIEEEVRHRRSTLPAPKDKLEKLPLTRERFEE